MKIVVNGRVKEIEEETNLRRFLDNLFLPSERIAVELNETVVRRKDWEDTKINEADKIEVIHFVGGG